MEYSKGFSHKGTINRYISTIHKEMSLICQKCGETFNRKFALKRHMENCGENYKCDVCDNKYGTTVNLKSIK